MALIPDLPAASGLSASDLFIIDTGSTTQKLPVSAAYASESAPGFVSTGAQTFAGDKTFAGNTFFDGDNIIIENEATSPRLKFRPKGQSDINYGWIFLNHIATNDVYRPDRFYLRQYSYDSSTGGLKTGYEQYRFPSVSADLTSANAYDILTSKSPVTIAQGGTGATTAEAALAALGGAGLKTGTFTPKVYDNDTYAFDLTNANYIKIGNLYVMYQQYPELTPSASISTMLQIRDLPTDRIIGGQLYIAGYTGQGGTITCQGNATGRAYFRPNIKLTSGTNYGVFSFLLFGAE